MNFKKDLQSLYHLSENAELEFKSAKGGIPDSFWETFSSFANTNGGVIVLGVKEANGKFVFDGLTDEQIATYKKRFWDCAHNKAKVSSTLLTENDIYEEDIEGKKFLLFRIPRASFEIRPVYLTQNPFGNTYKRNHEGDYHCTDREVRQMFADSQSQSDSFDSCILPNYSIDDIDQTTLKSYRQRFVLKKENHPWNNLNDLAFMTKIGAYRVDRNTGDEGFTRAGILMFGKTESITDTACAPSYFVDYQEKLSDTPDIRWSNRIYPDGTWEANLFQFFYRVYNQLASTLPTPFILDGITRIEETPAKVAIREALVNTIVHASYSELGSLLILRERNKIVMRNPGRMLISIDDFYAGSQSVCRNPLLQKMFMFIGYGEKAGSGADYIVKGCADSQWLSPQVLENVQPDSVSLILQSVDNSGLNIHAVDKRTTPTLQNSSQAAGDLSQVEVDLSQAIGDLSQACPKLESYDRNKVIEFIKTTSEHPVSILTMMHLFGEKNRTRFRRQVLSPLIKAGYIETTIKDVPNSPKQAYILNFKPSESSLR